MGIYIYTYQRICSIITGINSFIFYRIVIARGKGRSLLLHQARGLQGPRKHLENRFFFWVIFESLQRPFFLFIYSFWNQIEFYGPVEIVKDLFFLLFILFFILVLYEAQQNISCTRLRQFSRRHCVPIVSINDYSLVIRYVHFNKF